METDDASEEPGGAPAAAAAPPSVRAPQTQPAPAQPGLQPGQVVDLALVQSQLASISQNLVLFQQRIDSNVKAWARSSTF
eukprot:8578439-Pyramimonas_sp.AAC.1